MPLKDRALNRLQKKAKRGMRGSPAATIAFYGPDAKTMEPPSYGTCSTVFRILAIVILPKFCFASLMPPQFTSSTLRMKSVELVPIC